MKTESRTAKLQLISAMVIYGTIGLFVKKLNIPSSVIAMIRGVIGSVFLIVLTRLRRSGVRSESIRKELLLLCISGALIGANWIALFEAYNYTTVAVATLCYYMAPMIVIILSPVLFRERLTATKLVCVVCAAVGMFLISGVLGGGVGDIRGILFGLAAAVMYAGVVLINKAIKGVAGLERTLIQLIAASVVLIPYSLITVDVASLDFGGSTIILLLILGIVHTGFAYAMYFSSMGQLKAQTVALYSYLDPIVAIILSALILKEKMTVAAIIGAVLILGATVVSDMSDNKKPAAE